jgi:hypothetical protein
MIYGAAASYSTAGGGIDRRRRNLAAAAWGKISARWAFARVQRVATRCSRRFTFGAPDSANARAPQKICSAAVDTAPAEGPIPSSRAVYWRFFLPRARYSASVGDDLRARAEVQHMFHSLLLATKETSTQNRHPTMEKLMTTRQAFKHEPPDNNLHFTWPF